MLMEFKVANAKCYDPNEEAKIKQIIFEGSETVFERMIHEIGDAMKMEQEKRSSTPSRRLSMVLPFAAALPRNK
jgi:hypothetical protein